MRRSRSDPLFGSNKIISRQRWAEAWPRVGAVWPAAGMETVVRHCALASYERMALKPQEAGCVCRLMPVLLHHAASSLQRWTSL